MAMLRENGVQSFGVVPLTTAQRRLGAMGFGSYQRRTYQEAEINFMQQVANQVAVAVDNVLHAASAQSAQQQLEYERDRLAWCWRSTTPSCRTSNCQRTSESDLRLPRSCDPARFRVVLSL